MNALLEFDFLVFDVLAHYRVKFQNLQLLRCGALILSGGVEMAGAGRRFEFYFFPHDDVLRCRSPDGAS